MIRVPRRYHLPKLFFGPLREAGVLGGRGGNGLPRMMGALLRLDVGQVFRGLLLVAQAGTGCASERGH